MSVAGVGGGHSMAGCSASHHSQMTGGKANTVNQDKQEVEAKQKIVGQNPNLGRKLDISV